MCLTVRGSVCDHVGYKSGTVLVCSYALMGPAALYAPKVFCEKCSQEERGGHVAQADARACAACMRARAVEMSFSSTFSTAVGATELLRGWNVAQKLARLALSAYQVPAPQVLHEHAFVIPVAKCNSRQYGNRL